VSERLRENGAFIVPTALDFNVFLGEREAAAPAEVGDCGTLSVDPKPVGTLAAFRADPKVGDDPSLLFHVPRVLRYSERLINDL
jgi:hypothetical protein